MCIHKKKKVNIYICIYIYIHVFIYTYIYIYLNIYTFVYTYIYVFQSTFCFADLSGGPQVFVRHDLMGGAEDLDDDDDDVYLKKVTTRVSQNLILHRNAD
jgi:hypothetical protein